MTTRDEQQITARQVEAQRDAFIAGRDLTVTIAAPDPGERGRPGRPGTPGTPGLLPRDVPGFTGRDRELSRLTELARGHQVTVTAISGTAGVGKTALAVHTAHQLLAEFPDGHLYADLRGYTEGQAPVEPGEVLEVFLRSLGVTAEEIPVDLEQRSGLLRQLLAGKRVVMVLDNARTEAQVRPLLPGAGRSLVLVTSRSTLPGLEADERISLDVLTRDEAVAMLAALGGHRAAADPTAVAEVATLCGRLPLALRVAGQLLAAHPTWPVVTVTQLLAGEQDRLTRLGVGDLQVRSAFEVSYQQLAKPDARLFRLLSLHPGWDFTVSAAAALAGTDAAAAEASLGRLADSHLVIEDAVGRFTQHDLLRLFARATCEQADTPDDRSNAERRLIQHYENLAAFLRSCVDPALRAAARTGGKPLSSERQALAVFEAERRSLLAALALALDRGWNAEITRLSDGVGELLQILRYLDDLLLVREAALASVREAGDRWAEGSALVGLGSAYAELRRFDEAAASYQQALEISREVGDRRCEGLALDSLGAIHEVGRRLEEALACHQHALAIFREVSGRPEEGQALTNLGLVYAKLSRFEDAIASYQEALAIFRDIGDGLGEARALTSCGYAYQQLGRFTEAIVALQQALTICRQVGSRYGEGVTLRHLAHAYADWSRPAEAIAAYEEALAICREVGDRHSEWIALHNIGIVYRDTRRFAAAAASFEQALMIIRQVGDRSDEGLTLANLGEAQAGLGRFDEAIAHRQEALAIFRGTGHGHHQSWLLARLGRDYQALGQPDQAAACWREAAAAMRAAGDHEEAARLEQLAADAPAPRRRWWRRPGRPLG